MLWLGCSPREDRYRVQKNVNSYRVTRMKGENMKKLSFVYE